MGRRARGGTSRPREEMTSAFTGRHHTLAPKMKVWIVLADQVQFGHGRAQLLRAIDDLGSIRKAAAQFGMSYRRAWGYLRELEAAAGFPFLERHVGRWGRGGTVLTPEGRAFLVQYERSRAQVESDIAQHFAACFPQHT
jgi:molybdate transport system regulatory protein